MRSCVAGAAGARRACARAGRDQPPACSRLGRSSCCCSGRKRWPGPASSSASRRSPRSSRCIRRHGRSRRLCGATKGSAGARWPTLLSMVITGLAVEFALDPVRAVPLSQGRALRSGAPTCRDSAHDLRHHAARSRGAAARRHRAGRPLWRLADMAIDLLLWDWRIGRGSARGQSPCWPRCRRWAFALMVVGGLWLCLWTTRPRLLGLRFRSGDCCRRCSPGPDLLITGDGRHLAIVGPDGTPLMLRDRRATSCAT